MLTCRVIPFQIGDGPTNMALDEALLDSVASDPRSAVVRTYAWSLPTLSLGYFQSFAAVEADPRWADVPIVRRATGGGALWHDRELTYSVVVPAAHPLARPSTALYRAIHTSISQQLRHSGLAAGRRGEENLLIAPRVDRPFLCFQDRDADDVVVGQVKLVGSAQRRRAGAVLQHGSLLLSRSPTTPELPGVGDLVSKDEVGDEPTLFSSDTTVWAKSLAQALSAVLGGTVFYQDFQDEELDRADILRRSTYAKRGWTLRR